MPRRCEALRTVETLATGSAAGADQCFAAANGGPAAARRPAGGTGARPRRCSAGPAAPRRAWTGAAGQGGDAAFVRKAAAAACDVLKRYPPDPWFIPAPPWIFPCLQGRTCNGPAARIALPDRAWRSRRKTGPLFQTQTLTRTGHAPAPGSPARPGRAPFQPRNACAAVGRAAGTPVRAPPPGQRHCRLTRRLQHRRRPRFCPLIPTAHPISHGLAPFHGGFP